MDGEMFQSEPERSEQAPESYTYWLAAAWRRKSLLALGLVVGLVLGSFLYARAVPIYQSRLQVMVIKKAGNPLASTVPDPRQQFYEDYIPTHQELIKSPLIVQEAVEKHELFKLKSFAGPGDPTGAILGSLATERNNTAGSTIINLTYRGGVAEDCPVVLKAVVDSYRAFLRRKYESASDETLAKITELTDTLRKDLEKKENAYAEFRKHSPLVYWKGGEGSHPQEDWFSQIQAKRLNLLVRRADLQARLRSIEDALKEGRGQTELLNLVKTTNDKPGPNGNLEEQLFNLRLQEQSLLGDYGTDHPDVVAVRRRIAITREFYANLAAESEKARPDGGVVENPVERRLQALRQELSEADRSVAVLDEMLENEQKGAREMAKFKDEDKRYRDDIARAQSNFEPILKQLENIKLIRDLGGFDAEIISPPGMGAPTRSSGLQSFLMGGLLGLLGGCGLIYLAEVTDKSFRTPEEIQRSLGYRLIGHVPLIEAQAEEGAEAGADGAPADPGLYSFHRAKSFQAEAFRKIRTALYFSTGGKVHKVIQVTSPEPGDGKSTSATNLAISIAQSGKRVILLDADLRKPRAHKIFGLAADRGLSTVITGVSGLEESIQKTRVEGLSVLSSGPRPPNPADLLTSPRFDEIIDTLRAEYDFVLVDTPPLLVVSDPSVIATRVDGVLLVVRISDKNRVIAERAKEVLRTMGAKVIGVVVNGAVPGAGSGSYGPESNYSYGYSYGYSYKYEDDVAYYEDEDEPTEDAASPDRARDGRRRTNGSKTSRAGRRGDGHAPGGLINRLMHWFHQR